MPKTYLPLILILLILLTSCYKHDDLHLSDSCKTDCTVFNVQVNTGNNSSVPVNAAYVELIWVNINSFFTNTSSFLAKGYTDENGKITFSLKLPANEFTSGRFTINSHCGNDYFNSTRPFYGITKADTTLNCSVHLPSKANLKLVLRNFHPTSTDDFFIVSANFNYYGSEYDAPQKLDPTFAGYPGLYSYNTQTQFDSLILNGVTAGDQITYITNIKIKNGVKVFFTDSIYFAKGDSKTYEVDFQK